MVLMMRMKTSSLLSTNHLMAASSLRQAAAKVDRKSVGECRQLRKSVGHQKIRELPLAF